jgi:hypothetical protein
MGSTQPEIPAIGLKQRFPMISKMQESQQVAWEVGVPLTYLSEGAEFTEMPIGKEGFCCVSILKTGGEDYRSITEAARPPCYFGNWNRERRSEGLRES